MLATFRDAGAPMLAWGATDAFSGVDMPAALAPIQLEYAAIRRHAALLDLPCRAVIEVQGSERLAFLDRMITQQVKGMPAGAVRRSFWLNRKGRVDADLRVVNFADRTLLDVDVLAAQRTLAGLSSYVFSEDVAFHDRTQATHRLALHGPTAAELLSMVCGAAVELAEGAATEVGIGGVRAAVFREDSAGVPGYELVVEAGAVAAVVGRLIEVGHDPRHDGPGMHDEPGRAIALRQADSPAAHIRLRPIGWHAYNIARVEAGTALYNLDFGPESLPAETGVLNDRVSFTKGCYLGQEVVARMHARKAVKQSLVCVRFEAVGGSDDELPLVPDAGSPLLADKDGPADPVGTITSAVISPMLSRSPVAFAQIRSGHCAPGARVWAGAEGRTIAGVVLPGLRTLSTP